MLLYTFVPLNPKEFSSQVRMSISSAEGISLPSVLRGILVSNIQQLGNLLEIKSKVVTAKTLNTLLILLVLKLLNKNKSNLEIVE